MHTQHPVASLASLCAARKELKDILDAEETDYKARKAALEGSLAHVENCLVDRLNARQGENLMLDDGRTISRRTNVFVQVDDWDAFDAHILATGNLRLLHKTAGRNACVEEIEKHTPDGVKAVDYFNGKVDLATTAPLPTLPGVKLSAEYIVSVSKGKTTT